MINPIKLYIDLPESKIMQTPVAGMTAADEFSIRIPDALLNGSATISVIQHCCPEIKYPKLLRSSEIPKLIAAIRLASDQEDLELQVKCPNCGILDPYNVDMQRIISMVHPEVWNEPVIIPGDPELRIQLAAPTYMKASELYIDEFRISKQLYQIRLIADVSVQNEQLIQLVDSQTALQFKWYNASIQSLSVGPDIFTEPAVISNFLRMTEKETVQAIQKHIDKARKASVVPALQITCAGCKHEFKVDWDLDFGSQFRSKLVSMGPEDITRYFKHFKNEMAKLRDECFKMMWHMRGSITMNDIMEMSVADRKQISEIIKTNLEITKKSGVAFV